MLTRATQRYFPLLFSLLLTACSSHQKIPPFTASGYLADRGTVRIWRLNDGDQSIHLRAVYTPFTGDSREVTDYSWHDNQLVSLRKTLNGKQPDDVTLRFDHAGALSFMQRQLAGRREAVSPESVELYKFDADRLLKASNALLNGQVWLKQGHWLGDGQVRSCEGQIISPAFTDSDRRYVLQQQARLQTPLMVAWLEAPQGVQLVWYSAQDECSWQPTAEDLAKNE
ncbi:DUF1481 domain-containing protein [Pantoea sp. A4]|uniref:DUF1481 domain-containing protein n=1 Tax=Pantoea sp. A4 TaxID=1225184 RepID=UPI000474B898|nr:DUF1481 domain-containing protein [Pantoea sp. A4]